MAYVDTVGDIVHGQWGVSYPNGQVQMPGLHLLCTQTGGTDSRPLLCAQFDSLFVAHLLVHLSSTAFYEGSRVAMAKSALKNQPVITTSHTAGTAPGAPLPSQVRVLTKLITAFSGREFRGRVYGNTPDGTDQGLDMHPAAPLLAKWFTVVDTFRAGTIVGGSSWQLVVFHRDKINPLASSGTPVIKVTPMAKWATQRKGGDYGRLNVNPPW